MNRPEIIFFGNGPLADSAFEVLAKTTNIIFHARTKEDLESVKLSKQTHPNAIGILASFGVLIKSDCLNLFEPEGILNIHPSLLPLYRGASPIESAILAGDDKFSVSIMKLVPGMDAGPIYHQETFDSLPLNKAEIYKTLAIAGATWLANNLAKICKYHNSPDQSLFPEYHLQDDSKATFTRKLDKTQALLTPEIDSAEITFRKIIAFQDYPKPKYNLFGQDVIILSAHPEKDRPQDPKSLYIECADEQYVVIDRLQPLSRKPMDAKSFLNGLSSKQN
ncbi:methionyl-tRNA formyltransferase [Candidatus Saccharibacteria bacterium]|nr:methionyl-tRNA formyltransferase [Candidatus Saccharibacteria bacterium]